MTLTASQAVWRAQQRRLPIPAPFSRAGAVVIPTPASLPTTANEQDHSIREAYRANMGYNLTGNGTSGATAQTGRTTTTSGSGSGMIVGLEAAGGVVTGILIETLGTGYLRGDTVTVSTGQAGTGTAVTFKLGRGR